MEEGTNTRFVVTNKPETSRMISTSATPIGARRRIGSRI